MISALRPDELLRHAEPQTELEIALLKCAEYFHSEYLDYKHQSENPDLSDFDEYVEIAGSNDELTDQVSELKDGIIEALDELSDDCTEENISKAIKILEALK
jgi:hypothetical protein